jgi:hypothetical protein
MGDLIDMHGKPVPTNDDFSPELVTDLARFSEGLVTEKAIRKRYRFDEDTWKALGSNDALVEAIEDEKVRRIRSGNTKRERAQVLVTEAPNVLGSIMNDPSASPRHRVDACKTLDTFAANGPEAAPASDRFVITINLGSDTLRFDKSIAPNANDIDPFNDVDATPQDVIAAIATTKPNGGNDGGHL